MGLTGRTKSKKASVTDSELVKRTKAGDLGAFESLVKKYEPRVAATVTGMLGNCQAADDVGQEVFIRFFKYLENFREEAALGTYLTRIAINLSLNELKRRKRRRQFFVDSDGEKPETAGAPDAGVAGFETRQVVEDALQRLAPEFRSVLVLRLLDGYSTAETADILKIPTGTVLSRLSRAQQKLKEYLVPIVKEDT